MLLSIIDRILVLQVNLCRVDRTPIPITELCPLKVNIRSEHDDDVSNLDFKQKRTHSPLKSQEMKSQKWVLTASS